MSQRRYRACALPMNKIPPHTACSGYIIYVVLHQNIFLQRWHDIQDALRLAPPLQTHRSIHSPAPVISTITSHHHSGTLNLSPLSYAPSPRHIINLTLNEHTVIAIDKILAETTAHDNARVHLSHPQVPPKLSHLGYLQTTIR